MFFKLVSALVHMVIFHPLPPLCVGVGIGVVDVGYERRLANHLGAHRTPSILAVINGKVTFFNYALAKEHLMQFVEDLLPQRLVEKVSSGLCLFFFFLSVD